MTYYNTNQLDSQQKARATRDNANQEQLIRFAFADGGWHSPSEVLRFVEDNGERWPLTSVRRAITNLTESGYLEKGDKTSPGMYGRPEHLWRKKREQRAQGSLF